MTLLAIEDLAVTYATEDGPVTAVRDVSLTVAEGETVALVGESGSGKSQTALATLGLLADNATATGRVRLDGQDLLGAGDRALNRVRGRTATIVFQEPMTSLDPLLSVGTQIAEPIRRHQGLGRRAARARALELMRLVRLPEPERRIDAWPHALSGGQRQRVMIAMALANEPRLLIADEPTTALDVTIQAEILALMADLRRRLGLGILFITHDLGLVRAFADRVAVMQAGRIVETAPVARLFAAPAHPATRALIEAEPAGTKPPAAPAPPLLEARDIRVQFRLGGLFRPWVLTAVDGVSLSVSPGETLGIVGESGSGKSTLGRALLGLERATGDIRFAGAPVRRGDPGLRERRAGMQIVFQDPFGALSPRMTVGEIVGEGLRVHAPHLDTTARRARVAGALEEVGLDPRLASRYPHEFSGGQRQRIAIARAMVLRPKLIVLDEPTSALDRSVQRRIVELMRRLQAEHGLAYLFISHDLAVVRAMADRVMVMKDGRVVEEGPTAAVIDAPREAYTRRLMQAAFDLPARLAATG